MVVLVAAFVFDVEQAVVIRPKVAAETAISLSREANRCAERAVGGDAAHEEVHAVAIRGEVGEMAPVGRQAVGGRFGIAKEIF